MQIKFTKMQGVGNDYVYVDARDLNIPEPEKLAVQIADRHFGVGSDGLVLLQKSDTADIKMVMYNADGSEGAMCGNAVRCIAKYMIDQQLVTRPTVRIETKSGVKVVKQIRAGWYSVKMGKPKFNLAHLGYEPDFVSVDVGNPHVVLFQNFDITNYDITRMGKRLEHSPLFPGGVNVEFARVVEPNTVQVRVWERGSGETLGCGTGACAVAVASVVRGLCNREQLIKIQLPGGDLLVDYSTEQVTLLGPAETVYTGTFEWNGGHHES